ncbi:MAG TPA: hypothetical protein VFZ65_09740 [Planctomycetota bacterium]|nr:hypothetical protein [Planctomycetota bacterium]
MTHAMSTPQQAATPRLLTGLVAMQVLAAAIGAFVPFGFDRPSELGLDFGHLLVLMVVYGTALLLGLLVAAVQRRWAVALLQLALAAATCWLAMGK